MNNILLDEVDKYLKDESIEKEDKFETFMEFERRFRTVLSESRRTNFNLNFYDYIKMQIYSDYLSKIKSLIPRYGYYSKVNIHVIEDDGTEYTISKIRKDEDGDVLITTDLLRKGIEYSLVKCPELLKQVLIYLRHDAPVWKENN